MKREIGSIFSVFKYEMDQRKADVKHEGIHYFSFCSEALLYIAQNWTKDRKVILIPAYTCHTVIKPFMQESWEIYFYPIDKELCIKKEEFLSLIRSKSPSVILFHPYYGKKLMPYEIDLLSQAKKQDILVVQDLTQSLFSPRNPEYVDISVGSIRKWFEIPDGAFLSAQDNIPLKIAEPEQYNTEYVTWQWDAMYLRGEYFRTGNPDLKKISIRLNKYAEGLFDKRNIALHRISDHSMSAISGTDFENIRVKRIENFKTLLSRIKANDICAPVIDSIDKLDNAPLYFPVYVKERKEFQRSLAAKSVYAPILWEAEDDVLVDDTTRYIYEHILVIPIDQRYDREDMLYIADTISEICDS